MVEFVFGISVEVENWELIKEEIMGEKKVKVHTKDNVISAIGISCGTPTFLKKVRENKISFYYDEVDLNCEYHETDSYKWDKDSYLYPEATIKFVD